MKCFDSHVHDCHNPLGLLPVEASPLRTCMAQPLLVFPKDWLEQCGVPEDGV